MNFTRAQQADLIRTALARASSLRLTVTGPSMAPTIDNGDAIEIKPFKGNLKVGEIALFQTDGGKLFVHRLIRTENTPAGTRYIFKGDGLTLADVAVGEECILGRVTAVWHRKWAVALRLPLAFPGLAQLLAWYHRARPWANLAWRKAVS